MDSSGNKGKATYLNCFFRSLMLRRVATLSGIDSGSLFLKGIFVNNITNLFIIAVVSSLMDSFSLNVLVVISLVYFALCIIALPFSFSVIFLFDLFLEEGLVKIANIFHFSGSHLGLFSYVYTAIYTYKVCLYKSVFRTICEDPMIVVVLASKIAKRQALTAWERNFLCALDRILETVAVPGFIMNLFAVIAFTVLLIRNIRALRKK